MGHPAGRYITMQYFVSVGEAGRGDLVGPGWGRPGEALGGGEAMGSLGCPFGMILARQRLSA